MSVKPNSQESEQTETTSTDTGEGSNVSGLGLKTSTNRTSVNPRSSLTSDSESFEGRIKDFSDVLEEDFERLAVDHEIGKLFLKYCHDNKVRVEDIEKLNDKDLGKYVAKSSNANVIQAKRIVKAIRYFIPEPDIQNSDILTHLNELKNKLQFLEDELNKIEETEVDRQSKPQPQTIHLGSGISDKDKRLSISERITQLKTVGGGSLKLPTVGKEYSYDSIVN